MSKHVYTLGIEEEFAIIDPETRELRSHIHEILEDGKVTETIAFIAPVTPLALAHGAVAGSQNAISTGVVGGMITATVLAIFFVPVFFQLVNTRLQHHK